jgi:hypothetical protein
MKKARIRAMMSPDSPPRIPPRTKNMTVYIAINTMIIELFILSPPAVYLKGRKEFCGNRVPNRSPYIETPKI